jgi:hypothetical protein
MGGPGQSGPEQRPGDHGDEDQGRSREDQLADQRRTAEALALPDAHQHEEGQGSVARSWNSRMPTASQPCWLPSSPSSDSCLRVIAVDDMATSRR